MFDLVATRVDPDGEGPLPPTGIELSWTEQMVGDYDQNGEVNFADITPLGLNFGALIDYSPPDPPGEPEWWPNGDPDDTGALNWRLARIDGDRNGELNAADVTPIAQHWNEKLSGYCIYHKLGAENEFEMVVAELGDEFTVARDDAMIGGAPVPGKPVRCSYYIELSEPGEHIFTLSNYDGDEEGEMMQSCSLLINAPPQAALSADPTSGTAPLTVSFDASESKDDSGIVLYEWDFNGDGEYDESTTEPYADHEYAEGGKHDAAVKVTDDGGLWDTASVSISVDPPEPKLIIMPDPDDTDWEDVTGTGVEGDPYVFPYETPEDEETEYSLVAYYDDPVNGDPLDPATLTWAIDPTFLVDWTAPGVFKPTLFTNNYVFATDASERESNPLYVVVYSLP